MTRSLDDIQFAILSEANAQEVEPAAGAKSPATALVEYVRSRFDLGVSDVGETFAVPRDGPRIARFLAGGRDHLAGGLRRHYFDQFGRAAPNQAIADALATLDGFARAREPVPLWLRVARVGPALWLDLGDADGRAIRIAPGSWSVEPQAPVLFKRTPLTRPLPLPQRGGDSETLWDYLNVTPEDRPLVMAWLVAALEPDIPHPVLAFFGQQGSGKTTALKRVVQLIDDSAAPIRKPPRDTETWVTAAGGSWIVALDNVSNIRPELSDALCRGVTGDGDVRRKLYTDADLQAFAFRRVIALSGIDVGSLAGDLDERVLAITLDPIPDEDRREERYLEESWRLARPMILGTLLDLAATVLARLEHVQPKRLPRMADFARIVIAVDEVIGSDGFTRYDGGQARRAVESLTDDPFIMRVMQVVAGSFEGTSADLLDRVTPTDAHWRKPKGWPSSPRAATVRLQKQAPAMRKAGWCVSNDKGANKARTARWIIEAPALELNPSMGAVGG